MDVNQAIVAMLDAVGVDHVFGGSGQVNGNMLLALQKRRERIKTVVVRNEQAASFMACGYAMFSRRLGVCFATGGPGAFNLFSGLAVAYSDSLPVLAISGYASAPDRGKGALNESSGLHRTPDSQAMFAATTKKSFLLERPQDTCDVLEEAIGLAFSGRPGPVHIHVPKDVTVAEVPNFRDIRPRIETVLPGERELEAMAAALARVLEEGRKICLLVGYGAVRSGAEGAVLRFAEEFRIPFLTTMDAKGSLPEDHALSCGVFGASGDPGANECFTSAGAVLALGNSFAQNATFGFKPDLFAGKILFHVNIDAAEIDKVYRADHRLVSDLCPAIDGLHERLTGRGLPSQPTPPPGRKHADLPLPPASDHPHPASDRGQPAARRMHPAELVKTLSRCLPPRAIVLGDAGSHMLWLNCYLKLTQGQIYQNPGSFGPMASHVNGALGAKCAHPERTVVCGCGDGAYLMAGFELLTAVQYEIPVVWVIFNNGEFNIIKRLLMNSFGAHAHMTFTNPDYVLYARACGAQGYRVTNPAEFETAFRAALASNRPTLIDAVVESEVYPPFALSRV